MPHTFSNINQTRYMQLDEQLEGKGHQKYFLDLRTIRTPLLSNRPSQVSRQHSSSAESVADCASHHLRPHSLSWASGSHHLQRKNTTKSSFTLHFINNQTLLPQPCRRRPFPGSLAFPPGGRSIHQTPAASSVGRCRSGRKEKF